MDKDDVIRLSAECLAHDSDPAATALQLREMVKMLTSSAAGGGGEVDIGGVPVEHGIYGGSFNPRKKLRHWLRALGAREEGGKYKLSKTTIKVKK